MAGMIYTLSKTLIHWITLALGILMTALLVDILALSNLVAILRDTLQDRYVNNMGLNSTMLDSQDTRDRSIVKLSD